MVLQTCECRAARCAKFLVVQFLIACSRHHFNVLSQQSISGGEFCRAVFMLQPFAIESVQLLDLPQPCQSPVLQFGKSFSDANKVATHMSPAKCQQKISVFDLLHGFVTAIAIDHQHAASIIRKMFLWHIVAAA